MARGFVVQIVGSMDMPSIYHPTPPRPITPSGSHYTFGYYDRCPWSPDGRHHLALRIPQQDHLPRRDESATVCAIDLEDGDAIHDLATTMAWNHQQGAMTHWLPREPGCVVFNDRDGDRVFARVVDLDGVERRRLARPVYCLSPDGRTAASIDFARIPRRGYAYAIGDPSREGGDPFPVDDGLWVVDVESGDQRLIASYGDFAAIHPDPEDLERGTYCWLNHAIFNCDGSRLMVLLRYHRPGGGWCTYLYTMDPDGGGLRCAFDQARWAAGGVTHQMWGRTPDELLVDADYARVGDGAFTVFTDSDRPRFRTVAPGALAHGHQRFSPDGTWLVTDTYPRDGIQHLAIARVADGFQHHLAGMRHPELTRERRDLRCDLHPRWRSDGGALSIDSIDDHWRRIYLVDLGLRP